MDGPPSIRGSPVTLYGRELAANRRIPLNLDWVEEIQVNTSAVERRAATIPGRRSVKKDWQAAWLLRAIACMDLTTLSGDDSADRVRSGCARRRGGRSKTRLCGAGD
jgi:deoxyribose-phosphate aldolase